MKIVLAADHGGFDLKELIGSDLRQAGHEVVDVGCHSTDSVDYPDYAEKAVACMASGAARRGILICGTGIGMAITANRHRHIRAANCCDIYTARMSREHNDANVLCLGARVIGSAVAREIVRVWLEAEFAGGRHALRIAKFSE